MNRRRKPSPANSLADTGVPIWHITTPIESEDLERVRAILKCHAVDMREAGNWSLLFLPNGTMKIRKQPQAKVPISTVRLPDGFSFIYEEGLLDRDGTYIVLPRVLIEGEPVDAQS